MSILAECPQCHIKLSVKKKHCGRCGADMDKLKRNQKVRYWINYRLPNGRQRREAVGGDGLNPCSIEDARKMESKRIVQKAEKRILDIERDTTMTFKQLSDWYLNLEKTKALKSHWRLKINLKNFLQEFGDTVVATIKPVDLENYQIQRKASGVADATIDHEVGVMKTAVIKAFENGLVSGGPLRSFKLVKKLLRKGSDVRDRILTPDEFHRICQHSTKHIKDILYTGYYTGMRLGEILNLTWDKVDMKGRFINLTAEDTKDREKRSIPICGELYATLKNIPRCLHNEHVFTYRGRPVKDIRTGLRKACRKAGVTYGRFEPRGFIFHDLRHTFNTNMRKSGVPECVIMSITGHSTREMFDRYNSVDVEDKKHAIEQLGVFLENVDQIVDQEEKQAT